MYPLVLSLSGVGNFSIVISSNKTIHLRNESDVLVK